MYTSIAELEAFRIKHLSRQGAFNVNSCMNLKNLSLEEKKIYGPLFNELKERLQDAFQDNDEEQFQHEL